MATDYDAPRNPPEDDTEGAIPGLQARRADSGSDLGDNIDPVESGLELPDTLLDDDELEVRVVPKQNDEFTCSRCFLVRHRNQLADPDRLICRECAA